MASIKNTLGRYPPAEEHIREVLLGHLCNGPPSRLSSGSRFAARTQHRRACWNIWVSLEPWNPGAGPSEAPLDQQEP